MTKITKKYHNTVEINLTPRTFRFLGVSSKKYPYNVKTERWNGDLLASTTWFKTYEEALERVRQQGNKLKCVIQNNINEKEKKPDSN